MTSTPVSVEIVEDVRDDNRCGLYTVKAGVLRRVAETSLRGIGLTLVTLREEGEIMPDDCVGVLDRQERSWLVNPWTVAR